MAASFRAIFAIFLLCVLITFANKALTLTAGNVTADSSRSFTDMLGALYTTETIDIKGTINKLFSMTPLGAPLEEEPAPRHKIMPKLEAEKDGSSIQYKRYKRHLYYSYDGVSWTKYY